MKESCWEIVFLGFSITSGCGNNHAVAYRGLVRELVLRGHHVLFLEREQPWLAAYRDLPRPPFGRHAFYHSLEDLKNRFADDIRNADVVVVGSSLPEGEAVGAWILMANRNCRLFYDLDAPVTLSRLMRQDCDYLAPAQVPQYDLFLSEAGGPALRQLEDYFQARMIRTLYRSIDPNEFYPEAADGQSRTYDLGYMGSYQLAQQAVLDRLLLEPARRWPEGRFILAGSQYPRTKPWPENIVRLEHLAPIYHRNFHNAQRFTLHFFAGESGQGYAPDVRMLEAAACSIPIISDAENGLASFFIPGREILISRSPEATLDYLRHMPETARLAVGAAARHRVLAEHTARCRAEQFEQYVLDIGTSSRALLPGADDAFAGQEHGRSMAL
jgi:spore maturation protein CgeB